MSLSLCKANLHIALTKSSPGGHTGWDSAACAMDLQGTEDERE